MTRARSNETSDLPPGVIVRKRISGDYFYYQTTSVGQKRREYALGKCRAAAIQRWRAIATEMPLAKRKVGLRPWVAAELFSACKINAKRRGIDFVLTLDDVADLVEASKGRCALTGIPFDLYKDPSQRLRHWSPSLDRINCGKGYEMGNVRLVANAVNVALSDFGEDVLMRIAKGLIKVKYRKRI